MPRLDADARLPNRPLPWLDRRRVAGRLTRLGLAAASLGALSQALLSGCTGGPAAVSTPTRSGQSTSSPGTQKPESRTHLPHTAAAEVAFLALSLVDTPYTYGGNTPAGGFDCSGLIVYAYRMAAGHNLPRTVAQLVRVGARIDPQELRTGDLVFFHTTAAYSHAGIYVGDDRFVHAPSSGGLVRLDGLSSRYWRPRFAQGRRV